MSEDINDLKNLLGELVSSAHRVTRLAATATDDSRSPAVWRTLSALRAFGPIRLGDLARLSRVTQPTMTKIVSGLDDLGWIKRIADVEDKRAWLIAVTPAGDAALDEWRDTLAAALLPYFRDLTDADRDALRRSVEILDERAAVSDPAFLAGEIA
ncbi:MarR family winged helix-turn-helix transcriptional regulator [Labedella endophytica]|uniref:MarR family winged helix-turn-helix transcriptional regulator n=1 Tax=Labedella endophytica TaxID=1523160 RepID=UPI001FB6F3E4|nr:MarR family transcriptional regulator [Labedella endophytica]